MQDSMRFRAAAVLLGTTFLQPGHARNRRPAGSGCAAARALPNMNAGYVEPVGAVNSLGLDFIYCRKPL
ncbi:MAG: hypothetical protein ACT4PS_12730, partial [Betaproteobacteria bacterium]